MSLAISHSFVAHTDILSSQVNQNNQDIQTWANNLQSNNIRTVFKATPWTSVITLTNSSSLADTNLDLTSSTSSSATHVILKVDYDCTNTTEATFILFRKNGDSLSEANYIKAYGPTVSNFHSEGFYVVPMDANQVITYRVNGEASASSIRVYVVGYIEPSLAQS